MKKAKPIKPGDMFNAFMAKKAKNMKKKKSYSESDSGSMKGYNPNLGMPKGRVKNSANIVKPVYIKGGSGTKPNSSLAVSMKKKHSKKNRKEHSAAAMKGLREFVSEEGKEKKKHSKNKKGMHCKSCAC